MANINLSDLPIAGNIPKGVGFCKDLSGNVFFDTGKEFQPLVSEFSSLISTIKAQLQVLNPFEDVVSPETITWTVNSDFSGSTISGSVFHPVATGGSSGDPGSAVPNSKEFHLSGPLRWFVNTSGRDCYIAYSGDYASSYTDNGATTWATIVTDADAIEFDIQCSPYVRFPLIIDRKRAADKAFIAASVTPANSSAINLGTLAADIAPGANFATLSSTYPTTLAGRTLCDSRGMPIAYISAHTAGSATLSLTSITSNTTTSGVKVPMINGSTNDVTIISGTTVYAQGTSGTIRKVVKATFATRKLRKITFPVFAAGFAGIYIHSRYKLLPVKSAPINILEITDSYGGGGYYDFSALSTDQDIAGALGLEGLFTSAIGGTGYVNRGQSSAYKIFEERLRSFIGKGFNPNVILTFGGLNDATWPTPSEVAPAVDSYYAYIAQNVPNALVISFGSVAPRADQVAGQPGYTLITDAILTALQKYKLNFIFINGLNGSIVTPNGYVQDNTGSGYVNNPDAVWTGSTYIGNTDTVGNTYLYIRSDQTHPTDADINAGSVGLTSGRAYLSKYVYNAIKQAIFSM